MICLHLIKIFLLILQGKRGIEKPPFQLPDFIAATGIEKIRQVMQSHLFAYVMILSLSGPPTVHCRPPTKRNIPREHGLYNLLTKLIRHVCIWNVTLLHSFEMAFIV
jgi:hypothetical protein